VGLNPFREQRKTAVDIILVVGTLIVIAGFVAWAALSG